MSFQHRMFFLWLPRIRLSRNGWRRRKRCWSRCGVKKMLEPIMYVGGVYKHNQLVELVEDLGGYILQKNIMQTEVVLLMLIPINDMEIVEKKSKELLGKLTRAPLTGTEIATVAPTLAYHHLPHLDCDVAEFLRKKGAKTNMVGLARG